MSRPHVIAANRSPANPRRWLVRLSCGHDHWVMRAERPRLGVTRFTCPSGCDQNGRISDSSAAWKSRSPEYLIWLDMRKRCLRPKNKDYPDYGGRGIAICRRWLQFENFLADMGPRPSPKHSIDRVNNDGNYEPGNCRWATAIQQHNNTRANRLITIQGQTKTYTAWVKESPVTEASIRERIKRGWPLESALLSPHRYLRGNQRSKHGLTAEMVTANNQVREVSRG